MKELIEIHCEEEEHIYCSYCDSESELTSIYYVEKDTKNHMQKYLTCCVDKVGKVIDWDIKRSKRLK